ncbi:MAG: FliI/YscN family ATPase [Planctomycetota bacterium]|nr:MAG: FliI/YscN family ATPase [Planctomycetota bacterium]
MSAPAAPTLWDRLADEVGGLISEDVRGRVASISGLTVTADGLPLPIGAECVIRTRDEQTIPAEVVALRREKTVLTVFSEAMGIAPGDAVACASGASRVAVGQDLIGRVIDARGRMLDGRDPPLLNLRYPLTADPPPAMRRRPIDQPLGTGIRALDGLLTAGRGQRLGVFAGTGVGKSVLMGMIARHTQADVNVIAMIGERGREVLDFIRNDLGDAGLARSVVVVCTSDEAPSLRVRACFQATAIAEYFRDQGADVLLMMDSLTRVAMAQRQIGLAAGEPPTAKGYPPSAFAMLPRLLERAGRTQTGSITGLYTVLVEGDDIDEPLADAVRGILDGHIWLARKLANRGHYPAIDVLSSISRVAPQVIDEQHASAALAVRRVLATWDDIEDLVNIGAYVRGADRDYDVAVDTREAVAHFLQQRRDEPAGFEQNRAALLKLGELIESTRARLSSSTTGNAAAAAAKTQ